MNREDFEAFDDRVRARAEQMWLSADRPEGGPDSFQEQARELVSIQEVPPATLSPHRPRVIEEAALQRNLGEFPTLVDQGEEQTYPDTDPGSAGDRADDIHLSDGDASDSGGVLPSDDLPDNDLPEVSQGDADVTVSAVSASDVEASAPDDLNDDGLADRRLADDEDA